MTFKEFIERVGRDAQLTLPPNWLDLSEVELAQRFLSVANRFFFQTYNHIGSTSFEGSEFEYFSDFIDFGKRTMRKSSTRGSIKHRHY